VTAPKPTEKPATNDNAKGREVAFWAGGAAFFGSVLAVGAFDLFGVDGRAEFLISLVVAAITAGAVYSKERLAFAKKR
jgi:hypothetical protein